MLYGLATNMPVEFVSVVAIELVKKGGVVAERGAKDDGVEHENDQVDESSDPIGVEIG